jgi:ATP-dependent protease ClpP protease subunit
MPSRNELLNEITNPDIYRRKFLKEYSDYVKRDVIIYASAYTSRKLSIGNIPSFFISLNDEDIQGFLSANIGLKSDSLDLILHSPGGSPNTAQQIVSYLRQRYKHIRAVIPQNAMSAATMIACACDEIIMAKHSAIGPIDPQIGMLSPSGVQMLIPANSIIEEFNKAKEEVIKNPQLATLWFGRINSYPTGFYAQCESSIKNSTDIVEKWLFEYMFQKVNQHCVKKLLIG